METYIIWAIISAISGGFYTFTHKVIAQRNYDVNLSNILTYATSTFLALIYCYFSGGFNIGGEEFLYLIFFAAINAIFFYTSIHTRIRSMKNIDTVIYFPLYKTFGPIIVTLLSVFYLQESLSGEEFIGIIIGISIPLLLITKTENMIQKNLFLGVYFVLLTAVLTSVSSLAVKFVNNIDGNQAMFLLLTVIISVIISVGIRILKEVPKHSSNTEGIFKFNIIGGFFHFSTFLAFIKAFEGNIAIAFTINSFSILIPIILSIIFYGEHFNLKKGIVIALSIISILLFI